jgi:hypothetical protein
MMQLTDCRHIPPGFVLLQLSRSLDSCYSMFGGDTASGIVPKLGGPSLAKQLPPTRYLTTWVQELGPCPMMSACGNLERPHPTTSQTGSFNSTATLHDARSIAADHVGTTSCST